jgi:hypothetical protein
LYDYQATRASTHAANFLQGFSGYLQVDGYAGYHALASDHCLLVGCMAHARRKFDEVLKVLPKASRQNKHGLTQTALRKFARLYAIEKQIKALSTEQRYVIRQEKSKPLMLELKQWYEANVTKTAKEAAIGKAFAIRSINGMAWLVILKTATCKLIIMQQNDASNRLLLGAKTGSLIKHHGAPKPVHCCIV